MRLSVGEKVQGPEPERARSRDGWLQEEMDERQRSEAEEGQTLRGRSAATNTKTENKPKKRRRRKSPAAQRP